MEPPDPSSTSPAESDGALPGAGDIVQDDRPCLVCGYNICGLPVDGSCPECGTPLERSLRGALLRFASPEYLARLHRGIFYAEVGTALKLATVAFSFPFRSASVGSQHLVQMLEGLVTFCMLAGWWMFSAPDPALPPEIEQGSHARRSLRVVILVWAGLSVIWIVMDYIPSLRTPLTTVVGGTPFTSMWLGMVKWVIGVVVAICGIITGTTYMMHLAARVPDLRLAKQAATYRWLISVLFGLGLPYFMCCFSMPCPVAGAILYFCLIEPWRARLKWLRKAQRAEALLAKGGRGPITG